MPSPRRVAPALAVVAVALVALNLRPGASSVGPVLDEVRAGLGIGGGLAGALTGLPGLCFGVVGATAVLLARRVGVTAGITLGLVAAVVGLLARSATDQVALFFGFSVLALAGMAVGNVLVPAWIKAHGDGVVLPTVYGTGLILGGALGALFTAPMAASSLGWQGSLAIWGLVAAVAVPLWAGFSLRDRRGAEATEVAGPVVPSGRITTSPTAVALAAMFGVQSMHAYIQFGWLPQIYRDAGLSATSAGALQALLTGVGVIGGLAMPSVIARSRTLAPYAVGFGVLLALGYLGLLVAPATLPWLWAVLLGVSGFAFPTAIALITARTRHPSVTAQLSGFVQPVGYLLAAAGPLLVGWVYEVTGGWSVVLVLLMLTSVPLAWAGLRCSRPVYVDDELA